MLYSRLRAGRSRVPVCPPVYLSIHLSIYLSVASVFLSIAYSSNMRLQVGVIAPTIFTPVSRRTQAPPPPLSTLLHGGHTAVRCGAVRCDAPAVLRLRCMVLSGLALGLRNACCSCKRLIPYMPEYPQKQNLTAQRLHDIATPSITVTEEQFQSNYNNISRRRRNQLRKCHFSSRLPTKESAARYNQITWIDCARCRKPLRPSVIAFASFSQRPTEQSLLQPEQ